MIQAFLAVFEREVVSLLRTRELYFYGLVPAICGLPVVLLVSTMALSLQTGLALPATDLGFEIDLPANTLQRESTDPEEWAVTTWEIREQTLYATAQVESTEQLEATSEMLHQILIAREDAQIEAAGGDPVWDRIPMIWAPRKDLFGPGLLFILTIVAAQISLYLIPSRTAEERAGGLFEALAVTATPIAWHLAARALAGATLIGMVMFVPILTLILLVPGDARPAIDPFLLIEAAGLFLCVTSSHVAIGCLVKTSTNALNAGSMLIFAVMLAWVGGLSGGHAVPIAGMGYTVDTPVLAARIIGTWMIGFGIVGAAGWWVRGSRALPMGHGDT